MAMLQLALFGDPKCATGLTNYGMLPPLMTLGGPHMHLSTGSCARTIRYRRASNNNVRCGLN